MKNNMLYKRVLKENEKIVFYSNDKIIGEISNKNVLKLTFKVYNSDNIACIIEYNDNIKVCIWCNSYEIVNVNTNELIEYFYEE